MTLLVVLPVIDAPQALEAQTENYFAAPPVVLPNDPPWILSTHVGIDEIVTDNVLDSAANRISDLSSLLSAGATITGDTARMNATISVTGLYRQNIRDTAMNQFSGDGYADGQMVVLPGTLYLSGKSVMDQVARLGGGLQNTLVETAQATNTYSIQGAAYLYNHVADFGTNILRYQAGQVWFDANTGAIPGAAGPISSSLSLSGREDFRMAGTIVPRLLSDVSIRRTENDSGASGSGKFVKESAELVNEYELTRFASLIGDVGFERLSDDLYPFIGGEDIAWGAGMRLRPNANSAILVSYGRHDLQSDFAGQLSWRLTPLTAIYADYSNSITNSQQSILGNNENMQLGPNGVMTDLSFDQSTLIGTLDEQSLDAGPGTNDNGGALGIPLMDANNFLTLQNGLSQIRALRATGQSEIYNNTLFLTLYLIHTKQLTPSGIGAQLQPPQTTAGANLSLSRAIVPGLSANLSVGYSHGDVNADTGIGDSYNASLGMTKEISNSLLLEFRYDVFERNPGASSTGYVQNAITIGLHKTFN